VGTCSQGESTMMSASPEADAVPRCCCRCC
jgi:hypothetical protein